jgi:hypothetical protein
MFWAHDVARGQRVVRGQHVGRAQQALRARAVLDEGAQRAVGAATVADRRARADARRRRDGGAGVTGVASLDDVDGDLTQLLRKSLARREELVRDLLLDVDADAELLRVAALADARADVDAGDLRAMAVARAGGVIGARHLVGHAQVLGERNHVPNVPSNPRNSEPQVCVRASGPENSAVRPMTGSQLARTR